MDPNLSYFDNLYKGNIGNLNNYASNSNDEISNEYENSDSEWDDFLNKCYFCFRCNLYDENGIMYPSNGTCKEFPRNSVFPCDHEKWIKEKRDTIMCNECANYMIKIYDKYDLDKNENNAYNYVESFQTILLLSQTQIDFYISSFKYLSTHCYTCNNLFLDESDDKFEIQIFCGGDLCGYSCCNIQELIPFKKNYYPSLCSICSSIFLWNKSFERKVKKFIYPLKCHRCTQIRIEKDDKIQYTTIPIPEKNSISWTELEKTLSLLEKEYNHKFDTSHKEKIQLAFKERREKFMKKFNCFCLCIDKGLPSLNKNDTLHIKKLIFNWFYQSSNPWENEKLDCKKKMKIEKEFI